MSNFISITEAEWELIEKHLNGKLSGEEQKSFDNAKSIDSNWEEKVKQMQLTILGVGEVELKKKLEVFHQPFETSTTLTVAGGQKWKKWLIAASVVACVTMLGLWLSGKPSNEKLFDAYYKADPGLPTFMGASDKYEFENAMVSYKTGAYTKAINDWQKLLKEQPGNDTLKYFVGSAYLANKNQEKAILYFDSVIETPNSVFKQEAQWYKALSLIYLGKKQDAILLLEQVEHAGKEELLLKLKK